MAAMLTFGTLNTVLMKMQDEVVVGTDADGKARKFTHPYFQCAVMFVGELFCLVLFAFKKALFGAPTNDINPGLIAIPALAFLHLLNRKKKDWLRCLNRMESISIRQISPSPIKFG